MVQSLVGMAAQCCALHGLGSKAQCVESLLGAVQPGTGIYVFCSSLAKHLSGEHIDFSGLLLAQSVCYKMF